MPLPLDRDRDPDLLRTQRDAVTRHYDARATTYDDGPLHRALADTVAGLVSEILAAAVGPPTRPRVVLDVGTGTGLVLRALTITSAPPQHAPSGRRIVGIGVDLSPAMLRIAAAASAGAATFLRADATALPLADSSVDVITCVTALHLLPSAAAADAAIAEWRRVLRSDGHVLTATFTPAPAPPTTPPTTPPPAAAAAAAAAATSMRRRHDAYATPDQLAAALAPHGLHLDPLRTHTWTDGEHHLLLCLLCQATPSPHQGPRTGPVPAPPPPNQ
ncbi:class I SAM-dependent methyltransferase [Pimelobacter simplex]|uniref:class I SAM-dependent methyltransferase n=1 Tax=Nocardioides simplex TaxID=2045 RepID=UPI003AAD06A6